MYYINDKELWKAVCKGEDQAFADLFQQHSDSLFRYGMRIVLDRELVKDAISDIFVQIIRNHATLSADIENIKAYLLMALRRKLIETLKRDAPLSLDNDENLQYLVEASLSENDYPQGLDDDELNNRKRLHDALLCLTSRQKEVVYLYYIQEIPVAQITEILDMNQQSVRNLLHRSVEKLRSVISDKYIASLSIIIIQAFND